MFLAAMIVAAAVAVVLRAEADATLTLRGPAAD
jgi:hypothetical protein